jgi:hypothetical protein
MNPRTADRLRFGKTVIQLTLCTVAIFLSVVTGFRVNRVEDNRARDVDYNRRQTTALYVLADAVDELQRLEYQRQHPGEPPLPKRQTPPMQLPLELDPAFQNSLKLQRDLVDRVAGDK